MFVKSRRLCQGQWWPDMGGAVDDLVGYKSMGAKKQKSKLN